MDTPVKYDDGKLRWDLAPFKEFEQVVEVLTFGANKYRDNGWMSVETHRYQAALMRHFAAYMRGESVDPESGLSHLAHAATNAIFLMWKENNAQNKMSSVE